MDKGTSRANFIFQNPETMNRDKQFKAVNSEGIMTPKVSGKEAIRNLLFFAVAIGLFYYVAKVLGIEGMREKVEAAGVLAPFLVVALKATTIVVVPLGGTPLYPLAGVIFGFWKGLGITLLGDAVGATIAFYVSRFFGTKLLGYLMAKSHAEMVMKLIDRMSDTKNYIRARLFFAGFPEIFAYASGLTRVSYWLFLPLHIGVHAIGASLLILFGDVLVTGSTWVAIMLSVAFSLLTLAGIFWFHANVTEAS